MPNCTKKIYHVGGFAALITINSTESGGRLQINKTEKLYLFLLVTISRHLLQTTTLYNDEKKARKAEALRPPLNRKCKLWAPHN